MKAAEEAMLMKKKTRKKTKMEKQLTVDQEKEQAKKGLDDQKEVPTDLLLV